jgi:hypothetical protein
LPGRKVSLSGLIIFMSENLADMTGFICKLVCFGCAARPHKHAKWGPVCPPPRPSLNNCLPVGRYMY